MLQAYSSDVTVTANAAVPFNSISINKGDAETLSSPATISLNRCGVYRVSFNGTFSAETTVQLYKDGVAQPQAQSTGEAVSFTTLVQVDKNNTRCCCSSPVNLQIMTSAAGTADVNVVVTKQC